MQVTTYNKNLTIYREVSNQDLRKIKKENHIKKDALYGPIEFYLGEEESFAVLDTGCVKRMVFKVTKGNYVDNTEVALNQIVNTYLHLIFDPDGICNEEFAVTNYKAFKKQTASYMAMIADDPSSEIEKTLSFYDGLEKNGTIIESKDQTFKHGFKGDKVVTTGCAVLMLISTHDYLKRLKKEYSYMRVLGTPVQQLKNNL